MSAAVALEVPDNAVAVGASHHGPHLAHPHLPHPHLPQPHVALPKLRALARHALPNIVECTVVPFVLFSAALHAAGIGTALAVGLTYCWGRVLMRLAGRRGVPGLLLLAAASLTARTLTVLLTGSTTLYFLAPSIGTVVASVGFIVSARAGRPVGAKVAADLLPLAPDVLEQPVVHRALCGITVMWSIVNVVNAAVATALLFTQPVGTYYLTKFVFAHAVMAVATAVTVVWFRRAVRGPVVA